MELRKGGDMDRREKGKIKVVKMQEQNPGKGKVGTREVLGGPRWGLELERGLPLRAGKGGH